MNNLAFCVHGHFYQPPREDPLTGDIPIEPGAAPYRNWNERINAQCYQPNALLGNFEKISFNMGPTLLEWMTDHDPETLSRIVEQDRRNLKKYGIGNAMAQPYNHTILPLARPHDKMTQVLWGIADFQFHFGHRPQGMWLPEAAVDNETLSVMADCGIEFTILAPWQADSNDLDISHPYWAELPGNRKMAVFFYNQDLSTRISFDPGATVNADRFALEALMPKYQMHKGRAVEPQLVMISSDGELYGHHQPFRDKFLDYLMDGALKQQPVETVFPGLWLRAFPPQETIAIRQNTSWSCHHGVTRWMGSCGCTSNNEWKAPLREALTKLGDLLDDVYVETLKPFLSDPWQLRHQFIHVIHGVQTLEDFITSRIEQPLEESDVEKIGYLLWAQYERQRIFTSCGWFFDDFDRIEPRNNVAYAAQAVWLTRKATGVDLLEESMDELQKVCSWRTGLSADQVFARHIQRANKTW
jgi:alpha-amylase/alpha-mannosidase (GH57 family)